MADQFENIKPSLESPCEGLEAVTPSDSEDLAQVTRALYVGGGGDLAVRAKDGSQATFVSLKAGQMIPVRVSRVFSTGTTATGIIGMY
ncbi:spike base protein, RCAP_Rcc01079 family [Roseobacter sp. S98]|uniref:spike base protein, RCAP_Rcc01079 family n=1 Tax=Roseobacter algicola (ex Choi et al. 2025) (nom. illeg.) TaxID=3092138 RepID=UPI0035C66CC7